MRFRIKKLNKMIDPFHTYKLFKDMKDTIFLDSSKKDSDLSKYSFIGVNPICKYKCEGKNSYINGELVDTQDPFKVLENLIEEYRVDFQCDIPFIGGAIGYFSYDIGRIIEDIPDTSTEDYKIPESIFIFYENIIVFDLVNNESYITSLGKIDNSIEEIESILENYKEDKEIVFTEKNTVFESNFNKEEYENSIRKMKDYILNGHMYIANMTRRIWCYNNEDSFVTYEKLRSINKAPFSVYMNFDDFQVISSSPERFLYIKDRKVYTRPIKGTRPRGKTIEEDLKNKKELINSEKDKSELLMIVDLERNDLSKVCKPNSVKVTDLFKIEEYATVFHLVSEIEGELEDKVSAVKCMKECFPGGSITGAPKIRAMEIIEELEGLKRNLYTGSIGYFDIRGNCDFNIVIRTIVKKDNKAFVGIGGGITYESNEEAEWFETIDKAKALMRVL